MNIRCCIVVHNFRNQLGRTDSEYY